MTSRPSRRENSSANLLSKYGLRWRTRAMVAGMSAGSPPSSASDAWKPPAEAATTMTSRAVRDALITLRAIGVVSGARRGDVDGRVAFDDASQLANVDFEHGAPVGVESRVAEQGGELFVRSDHRPQKALEALLLRRD